MEFEVEFYQKENGNVPVLDFLLSLQPKMRAKANTFILLNGFVKKTDKTPERVLERARQYKTDYERRCSHE